MSRSAYFYLLLLFVLAPIMTAHADCPETPNGTHIWLGVDTTIPNPVSSPHQPETRELDLLRVQLVWVQNDSESRYRDQHIIDIDWVQRTHTNVDVWDGKLRAIRVYDLYPVVLPIDTNFETGQIHIETCAIYNPAGPKLMFAHYGIDGVILETLVTTGNVTNQKVSNIISNNFNYGLADRMIEDVEKATGVTPGHYLTESFLFQNLEPSVAFLEQYPTVFFDVKDAIVMQSRVYVTGDESSALVPFSIGGVFSNVINILDDDYRVRNFEQHLGILRFQSRTGSNPGDYNLVIDARPDLTIETAPCVDGQSTLTANFTYSSELRGDIRLWLGDSLSAMTKKSSLNEWISCDYDYRVEGRRYFENEYEHDPVRSGGIWVPVATKGLLIKVQYEAQYQNGPPRMTSPSVETVLKIWDAPNIESLYGTHEYFCDLMGDDTVDSIDEIAIRRSSLLTTEEQASFDPFSEEVANQRSWEDGDGDGTICDSDEMSTDGDWGVIRKITLSVYPADN